MPHHESGLLALRTTDPKVLDQAVEHFLAQEPNHAIDVVRADQGRGVWLCFGSVIANATGQHVDVSAFNDRGALGRLAKKLGQPIWVGYAIGGYSNHQFASAFSADGKLAWTSEFDFTWPKDLAAEAEDPFTSPERYQQLAIQMRQQAGYGKISQEFGIDFFRVLDVNAGDALFARDKRSIGEAGFSELSDWLQTPWTSPEGDPGDGAAPSPPAEWIAWKLPNDRGATERLAGVITCALEHLEVSTSNTRLTVTPQDGEAVLVLDGPASRSVSPLVLTERFTELASRITGTALSVFRGDGDHASLSCGLGDPFASISISSRGGGGLARPTGGKPIALTASEVVRAAVAELRRPEVEEEGESEEDILSDWVERMSASLAPAKSGAKKKKKKPAAKKKATKRPVKKKVATKKKPAPRKKPAKKTPIKKKRSRP